MYVSLSHIDNTNSLDSEQSSLSVITLTGHLDDIHCLRRTDEHKCVHVKESLGEHRIYLFPYFSSSAQHVSPILLV